MRVKKIYNQWKTDLNWMVYMNVLCVLVALLLAQAIGGMVINIWDQQFYYKLIDGLMRVEMEIKKRGLRK